MSDENPITGVLLVNTGTPDAPHAAQVSQFLSRFLADPRVVELPAWLWLPLLNCVILPLRSPRSARNYQRIWRPDGSPLAVYSAELRTALEQALQQQPRAFKVELAFLYSEPFVAAGLEKLRAAGATGIVVLPMFPQCSGTTTGAVFDQVGAALRHWRALPQLQMVADFHDDPRYIAALADSVREHWRKLSGKSHLLMSFHGIPEQCVQRGDPYERHCRRTADLLASALELPPGAWTLSFQSRFGKARWLEPATDATLRQLAQSGKRSISVICPGFSVDCLETLEEIAIGGCEIFLHAGGEQFHYIGALNARRDHAQALAQLLLRESLPTP